MSELGGEPSCPCLEGDRDLRRPRRASVRAPVRHDFPAGAEAICVPASTVTCERKSCFASFASKTQV